MPPLALTPNCPRSRGELVSWWIASLRTAPRNFWQYAFGVVGVSLAQAGLAWGAAALVGALASPQTETALTPALVGALAALWKVGMSGWIAHAEVSLSRRLGEELRDKVLEGLLSGQRRQGAEDVFRILGAIREVEQAALSGGLGGVRALVALIPLFVLAGILVPSFLLLGGVILIPFSLLLTQIRRVVLREEQSALEWTASLEHQTDTLFRFTDLWRVAGSASHARSWVRSMGERARRSMASARARRATLSAANEALAALGILAIVAIASSGYQIMDGRTLASFSALALLAYRPLRDWGDARGAWRAGRLALHSLLPWLEAPAKVTSAEESSWGLAALKAEGFGVDWHPTRWTFELPPGALVLVVGPNGSGKTTLLRALLGLEPSSGTLYYGTSPLMERGVGPSERPFAWCPQGAPLIGISLEENLALGGPNTEVGMELLGQSWEPLRKVLIGEGGRALSGGERAWVSLARTFCSEMPVLLLDEPTASMDIEAESHVVTLLEALRGRRTVLVVTHRPELWEADLLLNVQDASFITSLPRPKRRNAPTLKGDAFGR